MILAQPPARLLPVDRALTEISPAPKKILLIRCAPAVLITPLVARLERAFPAADLAVLGHRDHAVGGLRQIVYPHDGFFHAEHAPLKQIRSEMFDLVVLPYATDRRNPPSYSNVDRIAVESGAPRTVLVYSDNLATTTGPEYFDRKQREIVPPYLERRARAIDEIRAFTGESAAEVLEKCELAGLRTVRLWLESDPHTERQVRLFYSNNDFYIYELIKTEYNGDRDELLEAVLEECEPGRTVVDFGGGVGIFSIPLAAKGCRVTHLDLPGPLLDFAGSRFAGRGLDVTLLASESEEPLNETYDIILSVFVVEHLVDPWRTLAHLGRHLAPDGKLLLAVDFEDHRADDKPLPLHLATLSREEYYAGMGKLGLVKLRSHLELDVFARRREV